MGPGFDPLATHNMKDAIRMGNRLIMMHEGRIIYDVSGEEKKNLHVSDLLAKFEEAVSYLKSKFGWSDDNPHAEEFLQLIKRRYL